MQSTKLLTYICHICSFVRITICTLLLLLRSSRGRRHHTSLRRPVRLKSEIKEILVCAVHKVVRVFTLVHPSQSIGDHIVLYRLGGYGKVVVRDLREEEVMGYVTIC